MSSSEVREPRAFSSVTPQYHVGQRQQPQQYNNKPGQSNHSNYSGNGQATKKFPSSSDRKPSYGSKDSSSNPSTAKPAVPKPENLLGKAPTFHRNPTVTEVEGLKFGTGKETNEHRIETRTKQIQFGKNTIGYDNYCAAIPREKRGHPAVHPRTPDPTQDISKRAFDGYIKSWRRALHLWDNGEVRPDLNPELVKVQVKKPSNDVKFDEEKALGQKRKISSEEPDGSDTELANETYANKLRKQQVELELGTERDEYAEAEERDREEEGEDLMEDGYISDDVL